MIAVFVVDSVVSSFVVGNVVVVVVGNANNSRS